MVKQNIITIGVFSMYVRGFKIEAKKITVDLGDDLSKYEDSFLIIFNNWRENQQSIYRLINYADRNKVALIVSTKCTDAIKGWVEQYGKVVYEEDCTVLALEEVEEFEAFVDADYIW